MHFRAIFEHSKDKETVKEKTFKWIKKINGNEFGSFQTAGSSIINHFDNRSINVSAEFFNAEIRSFRATFRGVRDVNFFYID
ncbi:MAG: transposase [Bacteroidetes bacterium]|nr:transposase [Bacteroidota bacterium]